MFDFLIRPLRRHFGPDKEYYRIFYRMLGVTPDNIELYKLALVHRSVSIHLDEGGVINNERLEFLGDAVLESIVSDFLFIEFPAHTEGFLTQMRSRIVSRSSLDELACQLGIDGYVIANRAGTYIQKHIYGNALEALIGAIYLDKGYDFVNRLMINDILRHHIDLADISHTETDYKSRIIEWCQKSKRTIEFRTGDDAGSTSQNPRFLSQVIIDSVEIGNGRGTSKKEAEQTAAYTAWHMLADEVGDYILESIDRYEQRENGNSGER